MPIIYSLRAVLISGKVSTLVARHNVHQCKTHRILNLLGSVYSTEGGTFCAYLLCWPLFASYIPILATACATTTTLHNHHAQPPCTTTLHNQPPCTTTLHNHLIVITNAHVLFPCFPPRPRSVALCHWYSSKKTRTCTTGKWTRRRYTARVPDWG